MKSAHGLLVVRKQPDSSKNGIKRLDNGDEVNHILRSPAAGSIGNVKVASRSEAFCQPLDIANAKGYSGYKPVKPVTGS
jgi:hypothetical protein